MKRAVWALVMCFGLGVFAATAEVLVVVNPEYSGDSIATKDVESLFLGRKKKLPDGQAAVLACLKGGDVHQAFLKSCVGRSESQFRSHWKKAVFSGSGKPPKTFETEDELLAFVAKTPGAIGYINSGTDASAVKTLSVK